jgi:hypothetical protein
VPRVFGLSRAVLHRAGAEWPVVGVAFLLLLASTTLLAAGALYAETVAIGGIRRVLMEVPPSERAILVRVSASPAAVAGLDEVIRPEVEGSIREPGGEVARVIRSGTYADAAVPRDEVDDLTVLSALEGLERHAVLSAGRWAQAGQQPIEATLSEGAAAALGLGVGDTVSLVDRLDQARTVDVVVAGTWRADGTDPYYLDDPLELTGIEQGEAFVVRGPFVLAPDDLLAIGGRRPLDVSWRGLVRVDGLRADRLAATATDIGSLRERITAGLPNDVDPTVTTRLPQLLMTVERSALVSRSGVLLLTAQFAVLAGYAVVLVAGMLAERRRSETALLRARGAGTGHLAAMSLLEAIALAVPVAVLAPLLAFTVVTGLDSFGPLGVGGIGAATFLPGTVVPVTLVSVGLGVLALTLPSIPSGGSPTASRASAGRPSGRTLAQRLGVDLAFVVLAAVALWQLRLYGAPLTENARGILGIDPLLIAAPAIGLLAGAVLAIRIVPRLAEVAERVLERRRGLVSPLGARQLARRPLRYTRSALLLMLAAALGTFAVAFAATWSRSQADQATYQAAADLRVIESDYTDVPSWAVGQTYRAMDGVTAATPVVRQSLDLGRSIRGGELLAVEPETVESLVTLPPEARVGDAADGVAALLAPLVEGRWGAPTVALPGEPQRLAIELDAELAVPSEMLGPDEPEPAGGSVGIAIVLSDGDGRLHRLTGQQIRTSGRGQRAEVSLGDADGQRELLAPISLEAIELTITPPAGYVLGGSVGLGRVLVAPSSADEDWTAVPFDTGGAAWKWIREQTAPRSGIPGELTLRPPGGSGSSGEFRTDPVVGWMGEAEKVFRFLAPPTGGGASGDAVSAIVSPSFLEASGTEVGDTTMATTYGQDLPILTVGMVDAFPTLDPAVPFVIVDLSTLDQQRLAEAGHTVAAGEWWLAVDDARADAVAAEILAIADDAEVIGRLALTERLLSDPIPLGVIGALGLGAAAALAFAAIGFVVSAAVSTNERLGEFALLQAIGLSASQLAGWLSIEHAFLLAIGLLSGVAVGLLLAWLVLPFATLTTAGTAAVPAPVVVLPIEPFVPLAIMAVALLGGTVLLVTRQLRTVDLAGLLRAQDG